MLSVDPEVKYESDGGPKFPDLIATMRNLHVPLNETLALVDMFFFNYLIGNADAHAKNYSVVTRNRKPELAPMYDAVSTLVYPDLSRDFAMSIGGETSVGCIGRKNFEALAEACGMSPKLFLARLDALASRIFATAEELAKQLNSAWPSPVYGEVLKVVSSQVKRIRGELGEVRRVRRHEI